VGIESLAEVIAYLSGEIVIEEYAETAKPKIEVKWPLLSDVRGQKLGKRALLIAAAGGHNLLMLGPPGCGKSMLAQRLPGLLPPLTSEEQLEVVKIHSIAGMPLKPLLAGQRPFRSPHHVVSEAALVGGGAVPHPGEISLAHNGVLFLDEFPEFRRPALEALRAPLEMGSVIVSRAKGRSSFPSRFQLVAAMNSCPCGRRGAAGSECQCSRAAIQKYLQKLSRPILDRIDLHVEMDAVALKDMTRETKDNERRIDDEFRNHVLEARQRQYSRAGKLNSALSADDIRSGGCLAPGAIETLERSANAAGLSARGIVRVLRVARTIADIAENGQIVSQHVSEAISFRSLERLEKL
jgi:magnesium chelatase family protein